MRDKWGLTLVHRLVAPNRWLVAYLCRHFLSTMNNITITHPDPSQDGWGGEDRAGGQQGGLSLLFLFFVTFSSRWQCSVQLPRPVLCPATQLFWSTTGRWRRWSRFLLFWSSAIVINPHHHPHRTLENQSQVEAALSILLAAGFSVQLAWINSSQPLDGSWQPLQNLWYTNTFGKTNKHEKLNLNTRITTIASGFFLQLKLDWKTLQMFRNWWVRCWYYMWVLRQIWEAYLFLNEFVTNFVNGKSS